MMTMMKRWWYYIFVVVAMAACLYSFKDIGNPPQLCQDSKTDKKDCYIFYGIIQNHLEVSKDRSSVKVNYLIKGFPAVKHELFVEIMLPDGTIDFLYSKSHTANHKAHYHPKMGARKYVSSYDIPHKKLGVGKYKLRVRFDFKFGISGHLKPDEFYSNWMKFEIKP